MKRYHSSKGRIEERKKGSINADGLIITDKTTAYQLKKASRNEMPLK